MKVTIKVTFLIIFYYGCMFTSRAQGWTQLGDFPASARDDGAFFTIDDLTYCGTGLNSSWIPTNDFFAFDMSTETWSPISAMPSNEARQYANGFASASKGYIFGGLNGSGYLNDLWSYDPITDIWSLLTPMPAVGRSGASCFVIGDTAYIMGGQTSTSQSISEFWAYSLSSDSWTQKNPLPDSLWRASAVAYQNKGYLLFGRNTSGVYKNTLYEYSPSTGSWISLASFPGVGRTYSGLTILDEELLSFAGRDSLGNSYNDLWKYSPNSNSWSLSFNLPSTQRRGGICFSSNTSLYYTTGIDLNDVRLTETWKFDPFLALDDSTVERISIYPNPIRAEFAVKNSTSSGPFHYSIASMQGKIVQSGRSNFNGTINVNDLDVGNYVITIQTELVIFSKKVMIH